MLDLQTLDWLEEFEYTTYWYFRWRDSNSEHYCMQVCPLNQNRRCSKIQGHTGVHIQHATLETIDYVWQDSNDHSNYIETNSELVNQSLPKN